MSTPLEPFPLDDPSVEEDEPEVQQAYHPTAHHSNNSLRLILIVVAVVFVVAGGAAAGYWLWKHHTPTTKLVSSSTSTTTNTMPQPTANTSSTTQQYVSNGQDLNLSFTYPSDWTVTPPTNNNKTDQPITVTSPLESLPNTTGTSVTGKIVIMIRPGGAQIGELSGGNASLAQDSVQFAYTKPTTNQHQYPYLTFIHLSGGSNPNQVFEEVMVTGISKFMKGQNFTADSLGQIDPIISAALYQCSTQDCSGASATPLSITYGSWQNNTVLQQTQVILASLQLN